MNDPVHQRFLQALSRRLPAQSEAVQRLLREKLEAAGHVEQQPHDAPRIATARVTARVSPLAQLNQYIRDTAAARSAPVPSGDAAATDELASVRRFRQAWSRSRSLEKVEQALARRPANAGPLNSHALVLHSLELMRTLSPDYLKHFLVHVETLQWLEQVNESLLREQERPRRTPRRARKSAPAGG